MRNAPLRSHEFTLGRAKRPSYKVHIEVRLPAHRIDGASFGIIWQDIAVLRNATLTAKNKQNCETSTNHILKVWEEDLV